MVASWAAAVTLSSDASMKVPALFWTLPKGTLFWIAYANSM